ncbi:MAG: hydrogenase maturation nickel metallochaperone HypA [Nanoarchaeota archaeon]|nr:hydrogenase maturation nickel metallochaperone HypA [Nanoarchaeota archaeon]
MKTKIQTIKCLRCGHEWVPRKIEIRYCPKCKSAYFDKEPEQREGRKNSEKNKWGL